jgi:tetratricopeptide (TPR) repeat protein
MADFVSQSDRPKAKEYAMRALALDDQLSEAHASLGFQYILDYNWTESGREIQRAIELDPNNAYAFQLKGARLLMLGRYEESIAAHDRAIEIEPTSADIRNSRAVVLEASGRMDQAIEYIKQSMELDPSFAWTHSHISFIYRMKGDQAASVAERARAAELLDQPDEATKLRDTFRAVGWTGYLRQLLQQNWGVLGRSPTRVASLQAELGQKEQAIASLNEAAEKGDWWLFSIKYDPAFDGIRNDPRFRELLKKFDLPH